MSEFVCVVACVLVCMCALMHERDTKCVCVCLLVCEGAYAFEVLLKVNRKKMNKANVTT